MRDHRKRGVLVNANVRLIAAERDDGEHGIMKMIWAVAGTKPEVTDNLCVAELDVWEAESQNNHLLQNVEMNKSNYLKLFRQMVLFANEAGFKFDAAKLCHYQNLGKIKACLEDKDVNKAKDDFRPSPFIVQPKEASHV